MRGAILGLGLHRREEKRDEERRAEAEARENRARAPSRERGESCARQPRASGLCPCTTASTDSMVSDSDTPRSPIASPRRLRTAPQRRHRPANSTQLLRSNHAEPTHAAYAQGPMTRRSEFQTGSGVDGGSRRAALDQRREAARRGARDQGSRAAAARTHAPTTTCQPALVLSLALAGLHA